NQQDVGLSDANPILPFAAGVASGRNSRNSNFFFLKKMTMQRTNYYKHRLTVRLTEKERQRLEKLLDKSVYCRNMSELLREILFKKEVTVKTYDVSQKELIETLISIKKELHAIGVNINQVTRFFNSTR